MKFNVALYSCEYCGKKFVTQYFKEKEMNDIQSDPYPLCPYCNDGDVDNYKLIAVQTVELEDK